MSLVAKQHVAGQDLEAPGVLALSRFAGAFSERAGAVLVNLHDTGETSEGLDAAVRLGLEERRGGLVADGTALAAETAGEWARGFLARARGCRAEPSRRLERFPPRAASSSVRPRSKERGASP